MAYAEQQTLFLRQALTEFPLQQQTADACGEVEADDGHRYYVKGDSNGSATRASEWICREIGEAIGISTPMAAPIQMIDGRILFGSRRIASVADDLATSKFLTIPVQSNSGESMAVGISTLVSAIYSYDMFIYNEDRHFTNYLSYDDNGKRRLFAFDFSRAFFWSWPWQGFPDRQSTTRICGRMLREVHGFDKAAADAILNRIDAIKAVSIEHMLARMPTEWLPQSKADELLGWWSGDAKSERVYALRKGIGDGSLL